MAETARFSVTDQTSKTDYSQHRNCSVHIEINTKNIHCVRQRSRKSSEITISQLHWLKLR